MVGRAGERRRWSRAAALLIIVGVSVLALAAAAAATAAPGDFVWEDDQYAGDGNMLTSMSWNGVATDGGGDAYLVGHKDDRLAMARYKPSGKLAWCKTWRGRRTVPAYGCDIVHDRAGHFYVCGQSESGSAVLLKYNSSGRLLWARRWKEGVGKGVRTMAARLTLDASKNVYVAGNLDRSTGTVLCAWKFTPQGDRRWRRIVSNPWGYNTSLVDMAGDGKGQMYLAGWSLREPGGYQDALVCKIQRNGRLVWRQRIGGYVEADCAPRAIACSNGVVAVVGRSGTDIPLPGTWEWEYAWWEYSGWMQRYTAGGSASALASWTSPVGLGRGFDDVAIDPVGNVHVAGWWAYLYGDPAYWGAYRREYMTVTFDPLGQVLYDYAPLPTWGSDVTGRLVQCDASGNTICVGERDTGLFAASIASGGGSAHQAAWLPSNFASMYPYDSAVAPGAVYFVGMGFNQDTGIQVAHGIIAKIEK